MEWRPVPGFSGYSVSPSGDVRRDSSGRVLKYKVNQYGVVYVGLMGDREQYQRSVALLVANAYIPRPRAPLDTPINVNGDRFDNRVENLVWRPRWYAVRYNRQFREPYTNPITVPIVDLESEKVYPNSWECAVSNGLLERDVVLSILNRTHVAITFQRFAVVAE